MNKEDYMKIVNSKLSGKSKEVLLELKYSFNWDTALLRQGVGLKEICIWGLDNEIKTSEEFSSPTYKVPNGAL